MSAIQHIELTNDELNAYSRGYAEAYSINQRNHWAAVDAGNAALEKYRQKQAAKQGEVQR